MTCNCTIKTNTVIYIILLCIGFLSVQRFSIGIYNWTPALLLSLFLFQKQARQSSFILSIMGIGIFLTVDNGGNYGESPTPLRYLFYLISVYLLVHKSKLSKYRLVIFFAFVVVMILNTANSIINLDVHVNERTVISNLQVLVLLLIVFTQKGDLFFDTRLLLAVSVGYAVGELVNIILFYNDENDYLNYDSLKCLVIFPALYVTTSYKNPILKVIIWILTLYIVAHYGSRMLTISIVITTLVIYAFKIDMRTLFKISCIAFTIYILSFMKISDLILESPLGSLKAFNIIAVIYSNLNEVSFLELVYILDPVRYAEHQLAFDRSFFRILIGDGIGAGIFDKHGILDFTNDHMSAFSAEEVKTSTYFNFHDIWIDFGIRYGGMLTLIILFYIWRDYTRRQDYLRTFLLIICIINATFSISGLIFTSIIALTFRSHKAINVSNTV